MRLIFTLILGVAMFSAAAQTMPEADIKKG